MTSSLLDSALMETPNSKLPDSDKGKRSPDCVAAISPSPVQLLHLSLVEVKFGTINRNSSLNVPPLQTPVATSKPIHAVDSQKLVQFAPMLSTMPKPKSAKVLRSRSLSNIGSGSDDRTLSGLDANNDDCNGGRRAIFGDYWAKSNIATRRSLGPGVLAGKVLSSVEEPGHRESRRSSTPPRSNRKRSSSASILDSLADCPEEYAFRHFAPPCDHMSPICSRFAPVNHLSLRSMEKSLPPLPTPLRRMYSDGNRSRPLSGMYPLMTPVPILRQSSYRRLIDKQNSLSTSSSSSISEETDDNGDPVFNLTCSMSKISFDRSISSGSNSDHGTRSSVRFDPRVTVTEFEDNVERQWYSDVELEMCKQRTVALAHIYLLAHPEEFEEYNKKVWDPVTKTMRKKPLFSLPVLSSTLDPSFIHAKR